MRTNQYCLAGLVLLCGLAIAVGEQNGPRRKMSRPAQPIAARRSTLTRRSRSDHSHKVRRADPNVVHRFDDLFSGGGAPADTNRGSGPKTIAIKVPQSAPSSDRRENGRTEGNLSNPFRDHPETADDLWSLDHVEAPDTELSRAKERSEVPGLLHAAPATAMPLPIANRPLSEHESFGVRTIAAQQAERARWRSASSPEPADASSNWRNRQHQTGFPRPLSSRTRRSSSHSTDKRPGASFRSGLRPAIPVQSSLPRETQSWPPEDFEWDLGGEPESQPEVEPTSAEPLPVLLRVPEQSAATDSGTVDLSVPPPRFTDTLPSLSDSAQEPASTHTASSRRTVHARERVLLPAETPRELHPRVAAAAGMTRSQRRDAIAARGALAGFKGFCPVELRDNRVLIDSQPHLFANWGTRTYYFSTPVAKEQFIADPARYAPAADGYDVVEFAHSGERRSGRLDYCRWYQDRLYLFASSDSMEAFNASPQSFVNR